MSAAKAPPKALAAYGAVTAAYWGFMLTDGALRMLVLLHFHTLGYSAVQLAYLFLLYELAGMLTNLAAGWLASRFGLSATLYAGLGLQVLALAALARLDPSWSTSSAVAYVMTVQGLSGVAKDLAKMSSKAAVKWLAPAGDGRLFAWVAALTGSKNAVKGLGFLLGAALLARLGFAGALWAMAGALTLILLAVALFLPAGLPKGKKGVKLTEIFSQSANINWLSAARMFLFGARDVWFVVGLPVYFYAVLSDGSEAENRSAFFLIGSFMAIWVVFYGVIQGFAPRILRPRDPAALVHAASPLALALALLPAALTGALLFSPTPAPWLTATLVLGLMAFGALFALNSALHSYLILAFARSDRVSMDVGFYYMANAGGRLLGTALSGLTYQLGGLALVMATATALLLAASLTATRLRPEP